MIKNRFSLLLFVSIIVFSCSKKEDGIEPESPKGNSVVGKYEFKSLELNVDGNLLLIPNDLSSNEFEFKADGSVSYPSDLMFFDGKYVYDDASKTITFSKDLSQDNKSVLSVEKNTSSLKLKTKPTSLDKLDEMTETEANILFFSMLKIDESDPKVIAWQEKVGSDPKNVSLEYTLIKK